jgi:S-DNA-T family DNA segregation ATPase FtsK/SpoIIIE
MATRRITVSELKCACLDPEWRQAWMRGERPSTRSFAPPGSLPVYGSVFHQVVDAFVAWLTAARGKKAAALGDRDSLWHEMHNRLAAQRLDDLLKGGKVDSAYHLAQALKAFCQRLVELRSRTPNFRSWHDVYLAGEFPVKGVRFTLGKASLLVSGQLDAVRFHPQHGLEVVDYKLTHGHGMKHDLLQLCVYARLLRVTRAGLSFCGTLEYYEPRLYEVTVAKEDLDGLFDEVVSPILYELVGEEVPHPSVETAKVQPPVDTKIAPDLSEAIRTCYASFSLGVEVIGKQEAPQLVRYKVKPAPGVKVISLANRAEDLQVALALIQPPMIEPRGGAVTIDIAKEKPDFVPWRELVKNPDYSRHPSPVSFPVGLGVDNRVILADLADPNMCHCLVAGASGSGKSEFLKCIVCSLVDKNPPDRLMLTIIDPKILTFGGASGLPHLTRPVITDVKAALPCLMEAADEMERRYQVLSGEGLENLSGRFKAGDTDIPYCVIVFDEFADLILAGKDEKKEFEALVVRLAAKGRAAGIHLVLATQRPDRSVLTGLIKANLPLRVCLRVINATNSSIVLDETGGEKLLGRGDLLCDRGKGIERAQSPYITQDEFRELVEKSRTH